MTDMYDENLEYSLTDLSKEILKTYHDAPNCYYNRVKRRLSNSSNNGIVQRLNKYLSYDIEKNAGDNPKYKFERLQLLNLIYRLEGNEVPCQKANTTGKGVPLINILAKPRMQNVKSVFSDSHVHGSIIEDLMVQIGSIVDPENIQQKAMNNINRSWQEMLGRIISIYVASDEVLTNRDDYLTKLKKLSNYFSEILTILKKSNVNTENDNSKFRCNIVEYKHGVHKTFFNILYVHFFMCYDCENIRLPLPPRVKYDTSYSDAFEKLEKRNLKVDNIAGIAEYIKAPKKREENEEMNLFITLIKYGLGDCEDDDIRYAIKHIEPVLKLIEDEKQANFSEEIDITLLISIIQEIIYVHREKVKIEVDTVGYKTNKKSMATLLTQGYEEQPAILRIAWENRIKNRVMINFNLSDHLIEARKIENTIYKIKREVFSYINTEDIKLLTSNITSAYTVIEKSGCNDAVIEIMKKEIKSFLHTKIFSGS